MARKKSKQKALKQFLIICGCLIGLQVLFLVVFGSQEPKTYQAALNQSVEKLKDAPREKERKRILTAILDYRSKNSKLPDTLQALTPIYFESIPIDPDTGKPFIYHIENGNPYIGGGKPGAPRGKKDGETVVVALENGKVGEGLSEQAQTALINTLNESSNQENFSYDPVGKRDPFRPFDFAPKVSGEGLSPLEKYSLGQLKLTAVLGAGDEATAMVEIANGKGYPVRKGTKIGNSGGTVVEIHPDKMMILETTTDFTGQEKSRTVELKLRTRDQERTDDSN